MRRLITITVLAVALAAVNFYVAGCSGCGYDEKKPIATIDGKRVVTVGDFVYHYSRAVEMAPPQDKPVVNTYYDAQDFLDDIVMSRVLELEAEARGYDKDKDFQKDMEAARSNKLRQWTRKKIEDSVKVTEAEILDYYNKNKEWRRGSFIMTMDEKDAEKAHAELVAGKPWDEVVKKYSELEENKNVGGKYPGDIYYSGDNVTRALYATEVGAFTPVIPDEGGGQWYIFRVDEKIPGQKEEYAAVKDGVRDSIKQYKLESELRKLTDNLRKEVTIKVNQKIYDEVINGPSTPAKEKYEGKGYVIADVGGIPVYFDTWFQGSFIQLGVGAEGMDKLKKEHRKRYLTTMAQRLKIFEDEALYEVYALKKGADKDQDFIRDEDRYRAGKLVDRLYEEVFVPTIPDVTADDVRAYFEKHKEEFQEQERGNVYAFVVPDKADATEFYERVKGGEDIFAAVNAYTAKRGPEYEKLSQGKEPPPESKLPYFDIISVTKEAPPTTGPEGEIPLMTDVRPRLFSGKTQVGGVSELFQLRDGRWVFFKYLEHFPFTQHTLEEEGYFDQAKEAANNARVTSPEVDRMCQAWFKELRDKHKVDIDESALKMAFKKVQHL